MKTNLNQEKNIRLISNIEQGKKQFFIKEGKKTLWKSKIFDVRGNMSSQDYDKIANVYKSIISDRIQKDINSTKAAKLSTRDKQSGWPQQERAVDIGSKPRYYMHPGGTWPGRGDGPMTRLPINRLVKIENDYNKNYAEVLANMLKVLERGYSKDRALDFAINQSESFDEEDKRKIIEVYNKYFEVKK